MNDRPLSELLAAADQLPPNPVPRVDIRKLEEQLTPVPNETLAELMSQLTSLHQRHNKEMIEHHLKITAKINSIKNAINGV